MKTLNEEYFNWINEIGDEHLVEYDGLEWEIFSREALTDNILIDGKTIPCWKQLTGFVDTYAEATGQQETVDQEGKAFPLSRLKNCVVIGEHDGDLLFVDPSNNSSVWCYYHDGGDVEKLAETLHNFIEFAEPVDEEQE